MKKIFILFFLLGLFACNQSKQESVKPEIQDISFSVYASGSVKCKNQYTVFPNSSGTLKNLLVSEGDKLSIGQPLFFVQNQALILNNEVSNISAEFNALKNNREKLDELSNNIAFAQQKLTNDSILWEKQKKLWSDKIGTENELEQRKLNYDNAKSNLQNAILKYQQTKKQLNFLEKQANKLLEINRVQSNDLQILSEINGKVFSVLKNQGEMLSPQTPVLIIGDDEQLYLELLIDEYDISQVQVNQKVFVKLDSYKDQVFEAKVSKIHPVMNERSKSFIVEAIFVQKPEKTYPNNSVEANILIQTKPKALTIPRKYLSAQNEVVLKDGTKKKVQVGLMDYEKVEILSGLQAQDEIVIPRL